jgi:hypothetical protein
MTGCYGVGGSTYPVGEPFSLVSKINLQTLLAR